MQLQLAADTTRRIAGLLREVLRLCCVDIGVTRRIGGLCVVRKPLCHENLVRVTRGSSAVTVGGLAGSVDLQDWILSPRRSSKFGPPVGSDALYPSMASVEGGFGCSGLVRS